MARCPDCRPSGGFVGAAIPIFLAPHSELDFGPNLNPSTSPAEASLTHIERLLWIVDANFVSVTETHRQGIASPHT